MNPVLLTALCKKWQEHLRLQDWDVTVEMRPLSHFEEKNCYGYHYDSPFKACARIIIMDPSDKQSDDEWDYDAEMTLVHELIEILWGPIIKDKEGSLKHQLREQAVNKTARALVELSRAREGLKPSISKVALDTNN